MPNGCLPIVNFIGLRISNVWFHHHINNTAVISPHFAGNKRETAEYRTSDCVPNGNVNSAGLGVLSNFRGHQTPNLTTRLIYPLAE